VNGTAVSGSCSQSGASCDYQGAFIKQTGGSNGSGGAGSGGTSASGGSGTGGTVGGGNCDAVCASVELPGDPDCIAECTTACSSASNPCDVCICSAAGIEACASACDETGTGGGAGLVGCDAICADLGQPADADCLSGCEEGCLAPADDCEACICSGAGITVCESICGL
jgi:hypothetical protein